MSHLASPAFTMSGTGSALPDRIVTNDELAASIGNPDVDAAWIQQRTGIVERRWIADDQATSDLAVAAATTAIRDAGLTATDIDLVIVATSTPDWPQPHTAARVHGLLGMRSSTGAFDVDAVCSGWVQALHTAGSLLACTPTWNHVLVVGADTYSRITNPADHRTRILFGDGAGAAVISRPAAGNSAGVCATYFHTNFAGHDALIVRGGGSRAPLTADSLQHGDHYFSMDGRAVREFGTSQLVSALTSLSNAEISASIDVVIPHQSNLRMLEAACDGAHIPTDRLMTTIEQYGNTAAASIPITLDAARRSGRLTDGTTVALVGYGGGLSAAGLLVRI